MPQGKLPAELLLLLVMKCHGLSHTHTYAHLHDRPHRDTHTLTHRLRSISLVCNQDRRTLRAIIAGQRLRSGSCQGGLQFSIDRKMNGKENVGKMCGKSTCQPRLFTRISVPFWVSSACSGFVREEIRDQRLHPVVAE